MKTHGTTDLGPDLRKNPHHTWRLLVVSGVFPYPATNGYTMRTWALLRSLVAEGHTVDLLTFGRREDLTGAGLLARRVCRTVEVIPHAVESLSNGTNYWRRLCALPSPLPYGVVRFRSRAMKEEMHAWLRSNPVDAVVCDTPYMLVNFPSVLPVPLILNTHNIEHFLLEHYLNYERNPARRAYARLECQKLRRWEKLAWAQPNLVMACSQQDRSVINEFCPSQSVLVAPNVVDVNSHTSASESDGTTVVYLGGMDWHPNRDAVEYFVSKILPELRILVPQVRLVVAGRGPSREFRRRFTDVPQVEFTGTVSDIRLEVAKASVCVVPLRIGSGTRLKILEAAAMSKPIVSTRLGAEGLDFEDGEEILLADDPRHFARAVAGLLADAAHCRALGQAARRRVERHYDLPVLQAAVRNALAQLMGKPISTSPEPARRSTVSEVGP